MYVHEHIRYAESLAIMGKANEFIKALRQAVPVEYIDIVPCGDIRQSNCYYSSSDVVFKSRYDADERYDEVKKGNLTVRGGWRVYSSGPGIYIGLIISRLIGLRVEYGNIIIDPVLPKSFDGFSTHLLFLGHTIKLQYAINEGAYSPKTITINGKAIEFKHEQNEYRQGGAIIPKVDFLGHLNQKENIILVSL
jgi:cellobiose phosphorylase